MLPRWPNDSRARTGRMGYSSGNAKSLGLHPEGRTWLYHEAQRRRGARQVAHRWQDGRRSDPSAARCRAKPAARNRRDSQRAGIIRAQQADESPRKGALCEFLLPECVDFRVGGCAGFAQVSRAVGLAPFGVFASRPSGPPSCGPP